MKKLLHSLILGFLLVVQLSAQEKADSDATKLSGSVQTVSPEAANRKSKDPAVGIDPFTKDIVDIVSKIAGVLSFIVALCVALYQIIRYREERNTQSEKDIEQRQEDLEQRQMEFEAMQLNAKINRARFWLELRRMFSDHNEIHLKLRNDGEWSHPNSGPSSKDEWAKVEAYMGLFEHCQRMLNDDLIDQETFKNIYGYRVVNILSNKIIVTEKLKRRGKDWTDFLDLVKRLGITVPT